MKKTTRKQTRPLVAVTGGSGKAGRFVVSDLLAAGYAVLNLDRAPSSMAGVKSLAVDLTDFGQAVDALSGAGLVVHLAAIPAPDRQPPEATFRENVGSTFNVFRAAQLHRMKRVVWASSETIHDLPFLRTQPAYAPIDELHPERPNSTYALSKVAGEMMAAHFSRWTGVPHVGLRFSNVMHPDEYAGFGAFQGDPAVRKWNLWGYIDGRDVAQGCRRALEADVSGAENFLLAAADTAKEMPSAELMARVFPDVRLTRKIRGRETLLSNAKAKRLLGYVPQHSWRDATA